MAALLACKKSARMWRHTCSRNALGTSDCTRGPRRSASDGLLPEEPVEDADGDLLLLPPLLLAGAAWCDNNASSPRPPRAFPAPPHTGEVGIGVRKSDGSTRGANRRPPASMGRWVGCSADGTWCKADAGCSAAATSLRSRCRNTDAASRPAPSLPPRVWTLPRLPPCAPAKDEDAEADRCVTSSDGPGASSGRLWVSRVAAPSRSARRGSSGSRADLENPLAMQARSPSAQLGRLPP
mmetsp:Transcript_31158/g.89927  ORF Transcript_31158/g.89927 Transcript_31158/m.89927 type:complete len:238 (+) Transcript_31158:462-1175(+)